MNRLREIATEIAEVQYKLPSGSTVKLAMWTVRFAPANPPNLVDSALKKTYTSKPLVDIDGSGVFGEIAIVRLLANDGWRALWADTFHGRKFWADMPDRSQPVEPPVFVRALYNGISDIKRSPSGCFDVVAWKDGRIVWLEYKSPNDTPNRNEGMWVAAALRAGVQANDLYFIGARR